MHPGIATLIVQAGDAFDLPALLVKTLSSLPAGPIENPMPPFPVYMNLQKVRQKRRVIEERYPFGVMATGKYFPGTDVQYGKTAVHAGYPDSSPGLVFKEMDTRPPTVRQDDGTVLHKLSLCRV